MDRKAFLAWLSEVDTLSEAQKVEVGEVLAGRPAGEASVAAVELGCWRRPDLPALRRTRCSGQWQVAGNATLSLPILQSNLWSGDGYTTERPAPQGSLADVQRMPRQWRYGGSFGKALWHSREHRLSLATPLPCRDQIHRRKTEGHCRGRRNPIFLKAAKGIVFGPRATEGKSSAKKPDRKARKRGGKATQSGACPMSRCRFWSRQIAPARPLVPSCLRSMLPLCGRFSRRSWTRMHCW